MAEASFRGKRRGLLPGEIHPGAVVALAAAVFVATLLAVFSAQDRSELGAWWTLGLAFGIGGWLAVALAARIGRAVGRGASPGRLVVVVWLSTVGSLVLAIVGLVLGLSPWGMVLCAAPIVLVAAVFWGRRIGVDARAGVFAGAVLFLICIRLFTLPGVGERVAPKLATKGAGDVVMLTWNVAGGAPFYRSAGEGEIEAISKAVAQQGAHIVCLQGVPSAEFLDQLKVKLGVGWRGERSGGEGRGTAVLSKIGGIFQSSRNELAFGGPTMVRIASDRGVLNFVSCQGATGRDSEGRRKVVEWALKSVRHPTSKTVIAGDFGIDPLRGWTFLQPLLTDSPKFDLATWRVANVLGTDPGLGGAGTDGLGRRVDWVVVDSKMSVTDYRVLESLRGGGIAHAPIVVRVGFDGAGTPTGDPEPVGTPREKLERAL